MPVIDKVTRPVRRQAGDRKESGPATSPGSHTALIRKLREMDGKLDAAHRQADKTLAAIRAMNRQ